MEAHRRMALTAATESAFVGAIEKRLVDITGKPALARRIVTEWVERLNKPTRVTPVHVPPLGAADEPLPQFDGLDDAAEGSSDGDSSLCSADDDSAEQADLLHQDPQSLLVCFGCTVTHPRGDTWNVRGDQALLEAPQGDILLGAFTWKFRF